MIHATHTAPSTLRRTAALALLGLALALTPACSATHARGSSATATSHAAAPRFAIAIHGGAGVLDKSRPQDEKDAFYASLRAALTLGRDELARGGTSLDACEKVVRFLEDDPKFNAGKGAVYTEVGTHELDASIMDGSTLACGAVAGVRTVKNPISLARLVMTRTRHILLMGDGAEKFADETGVERVPNTYFDTPHRYKVLQEVLEERRNAEKKTSSATTPSSSQTTTPADTYKGTVGCVALDIFGNLAAATSTGGLTAKRWGRVGDSPIIGAGCYASNASVAVSGTGSGEQFIRHGVARTIANLVEMNGLSAKDAASEVVFHHLKKDDGGVIVVSRTGEVAMIFSTEGMFRGTADSTGKFEVGIWEESLTGEGK